MGVGVNQPGCDQAGAAVVLVGHLLHQLARLLAFDACPRDLFGSDHRSALDDAGAGRSEQPADVVEALHLFTMVRPPTTTLTTSRAVEVKMRWPGSASASRTVTKSASLPGTSSPASHPSDCMPPRVAAMSRSEGLCKPRLPVARLWSSSTPRASSKRS